MVETYSFASDFHGDRHDPVARAAFKQFVSEFKPQHRWFGGDLWDFRALRVGADRDEKLASMQEDFDQGMEFLEEYKPEVFTLGNHDQRLWDAAAKEGLKKSGPIADLARILIARFESVAEKMKTTVLPYDKRRGLWRYKGLGLVHGFDGMAPENMASVYGNVLYGHGHRIESAASPNEDSHIARMVGCLCLLDMDYNRAQLKTLAQQHGWSYGIIERHKRFGIMQAELINGQVSYAEKIKTIKAA